MRITTAIISGLTMLLLTSAAAHAQNWQGLAMSEASCGATCCEQGLGSLGQNPAGTATAPLCAGIGYHNKYGLKELSQKSALIAVPAWRGAASAAYSYYGFSLCNSSLAQISYAMPLGGSLSAGISLCCHNMHIDDTPGGLHAASGDIGVQYRIGSRWIAGTWICNISNSQYSGSDTIIPMRISAGISRSFTGGHSASLGVEKSSLADKIIIRASAAARMLGRVRIACGLSTSPITLGAGMEFEIGGFRLQFAARRNEHLGWIPSASVIWCSSKPKAE